MIILQMNTYDYKVAFLLVFQLAYSQADYLTPSYENDTAIRYHFRPRL